MVHTRWQELGRDEYRAEQEKQIIRNMEPKRYWWVVYKGRDGQLQVCTDIHPFLWIKQEQDRINNRPVHSAFHRAQYTYTLVDWKIISVEEYNLFNDLNN